MSDRIHFFTQNVKYRVKEKKKLKTWIELITNLNKKILGEINFVLSDDTTLQKINIKYLNTNNYTDVISFSLAEEEKVISGDIYISIDRVKENARKYKVTTEEELKRILIHGVIHLLGYDDKTKSEKRIMTRLEDRFLKKFS